jgi:septal ring factor EnvC (AmiA/AmiB activator)
MKHEMGVLERKLMEAESAAGVSTRLQSHTSDLETALHTCKQQLKTLSQERAVEQESNQAVVKELDAHKKKIAALEGRTMCTRLVLTSHCRDPNSFSQWLCAK